ATDRYGASVTTSFDVTVTPSNQAPIASDGTLAVNADAPTGGVLQGSDPDVGDTFNFAIVSQPTLGTVTLTDADTGAYTFDPDGDFDHLADGETEVVTFTYKVTDNHSLDSLVKTITVTVTGVA